MNKRSIQHSFYGITQWMNIHIDYISVKSIVAKHTATAFQIECENPMVHCFSMFPFQHNDTFNYHSKVWPKKCLTQIQFNLQMRSAITSSHWGSTSPKSSSVTTRYAQVNGWFDELATLEWCEQMDLLLVSPHRLHCMSKLTYLY